MVFGNVFTLEDDELMSLLFALAGIVVSVLLLRELGVARRRSLICCSSLSESSESLKRSEEGTVLSGTMEFSPTTGDLTALLVEGPSGSYETSEILGST